MQSFCLFFFFVFVFVFVCLFVCFLFLFCFYLMGSNVLAHGFIDSNFDPFLTTQQSWYGVGNSTKASELVPGSLLPHWNSMRFFARRSLSDMSSLQEVRFEILNRQSLNTSRIL